MALPDFLSAPTFLSTLVRRRPSAPPEASQVKDRGRLDLPTADLPHLQALQRLCAVHARPGTATWLVVGHGAVRQVLADPLLYSSRPQAAIEAVLLGGAPPRHGEVRRLLTPLLAGDATAPLLRDFTGLAETLVRPSFDVVAEYAAPLVRFLGARLVGVDPEGFGAVLGDIEAARSAGTSGVGAAAPALRRSALCGWLLGEGAGALSEAEAVDLAGLLATASTETAERLIVRCALILSRRPDLHAWLEEGADRVPDFVEEAARLFPPEPVLLRESTRAAELGGIAVPAGAELRLSVAAANRDPAVFDEPDRFDPARGRRAHYAFGGGIHQCLGAGIARRAVVRAVEVLLRAGPLEPAGPLDSLLVEDVGGRLLPKAVPVLSRAR